MIKLLNKKNQLCTYVQNGVCDDPCDPDPNNDNSSVGSCLGVILSNKKQLTVLNVICGFLSLSNELLTKNMFKGMNEIVKKNNVYRHLNEKNIKRIFKGITQKLEA